MFLDIILKYEIPIKIKCPKNGFGKQTLVNAERYITEELKDYEAKILGAEDRIQTLELEVLRRSSQKYSRTIWVF